MMQIREVQQSDALAIAEITNYYIEHTNFNLDDKFVSETEVQSKIIEIQKKYPYLVGEEDGKIIGFAHGYCYNAKVGYDATAGTTIYLSSEAQGKGYGTRLYNGLLSSLPLFDVKVALGGITSGNEASVALHQRLGFRKVAHFEKIGYKFGAWVDVEYWQKEV